MTDLREPDEMLGRDDRATPSVHRSPGAGRPGVTGDGAPAAEEGGQWLGLAGLVAALAAAGWFLGTNVLIMILAIVASIFLHELGHFLAARRSGMKASEFFIGFGPRIWSFTRGETTYGVKAIWAGAYVKILGMSNLEDVPAADEGRSYRRQSYPKRFITAFAGPGMNLALAFVLLVAIAALHGPFQFQDRWPEVSPAPGSAADDAGVLDGDRLVTVDGEPVPEFFAFRELLAGRGGDEIELVVERDGELLALPVVLERRVLGITPNDWPRISPVTPQSPAWLANLQSGDLVVDVEEAAVGSFEEFVDVADANAGTAVALTVERDGERYLAELGVPSEVTDQGLLGVMARTDDPEPAGLVGAVPVASEQFVELSSASVGALMAFFSPSGLSGFAENVVTTPPGGDASGSTSTESRTADGSLPPLPEPSRSNLTDENRVLSIVGIISLGSEMDLVRILFLVALVNIFLAIFNLIPLLPFDGGHILVASYERVREGLARHRLVGARLQDGRYCADFAKLVPLTYAVVGLIVAVGLGALWLDVIDPPSLSG